MMIIYSTFKGVDAVIIENNHIRCTILPEYGGKMASLYDKQAEYEWLYQSSEDEMQIPSYGADFSAFDSSGFDEMFPGIDEGPHPNDCDFIPDHGEVWAMPWKCSEETYGLKLEVSSPVFPYRLVKHIHLEENSVELSYEAINQSDKNFSFIWAAHALLNMKSSTYIRVPEGMNEVINVEKETEHLGKWGDCHSFPITRSKKTKQAIDLSAMESPEADNIEKFYFKEPLSKGWCQTVQPDVGRTLTYKFPADKVPYLGVWKTHGGYRGDYNFALEPCTGMYDDVYVADKIDKVSRIPAQGSYCWGLTMELGGI